MSIEVTWRPRDAQRELLTAALGHDPVGAINRWQVLVDFDDVDTASMSIMPLVAARLPKEPPEESGGHPAQSLAGRLNGLRRRCLYLNRLLLTDVTAALTALDEASITTVLAGGLAVLDAYPDHSHRPLPDAELLIARPDLARAAQVLTDLGCTVTDALQVTSARGQTWSLVQRLRGTEPGWVDSIDDLPASTLTSTELTGSVRRQLAPHVMMVEVAVAGLWPSTDPAVLWILDAQRLATQVDPTQLVSHARGHGAAHLTRVALTEARSCGATAVPSAWLRALARAPWSADEATAVRERSGMSVGRARLQWLAQWVGREGA